MHKNSIPYGKLFIRDKEKNHNSYITRRYFWNDVIIYKTITTDNKHFSLRDLSTE